MSKLSILSKIVLSLLIPFLWLDTSFAANPSFETGFDTNQFSTSGNRVRVKDPGQIVLTNALQQGKTILVDAVFGNDTTAKRENGKPFATLSNAVAAAQTWDTIKVRSGYHYGTTALEMPVGARLIGEGKEATIIHIERFNGNGAISMRASNYFGSFTFQTTNYDNNNYTVPFDGANLTNVVFENVRCSGYYDNWKITGTGRQTLRFFNCESFAAYDSFNISANTNCTVEFYGGRYVSDFTLGGATTPFDCRVIAVGFGAKIRGYGTSFEARNYAAAQAFQCFPTFLDSPPGRSLQDVDVQLFGCKIYSDGTAIRNQEDLYNESLDVTNTLPSGIYRLDGCSVVGEIRGPIHGSITGSNFVSVGNANVFSTNTDGGFVVTVFAPAHRGFIFGSTNYLATNGGVVGFKLTNTVNNTLDIGMANATKITVDPTNTTFRGTVKITSGTPGAGKVLTGDANGLLSWGSPSSGAHGADGSIQIAQGGTNFSKTNLTYQIGNDTLLNYGNVSIQASEDASGWLVLGALDSVIAPHSATFGGNVTVTSNLTVGGTATYGTLNVNILNATNVQYPVFTNTSATTVLLDPTRGVQQQLVAGHNILLLPTNLTAQVIKHVQLDLIQDGTGTRTVTFGTNAAGQYFLASGGAPSITTNANAINVLTFRSGWTGTNMFVVGMTNFTRL